MSKAAHRLHYHSLKQLKGESGAEFVDREQREYLALQQVGINVDDSLRLTKCIQQGTTNSKHRSLAQTIFSTPNMTLGNATSLFEAYTPAEPSPSNVSVNAVIYYFFRKKGHTAQNCQKKRDIRKRKGTNYNKKIKNFNPGRQLQKGSGSPVSAAILLITRLISVHERQK